MRAIESAKGSLSNALIGFAVVIVCKIIAGLVGSILAAPGGAAGAAGITPGPMAWTLRRLSERPAVARATPGHASIG